MRRRSRKYKGRVINRYLRMAHDLPGKEKGFAIQRWKHKIRGAAADLTVTEWEEMSADGVCYWCGGTFDSLTVDHVLPKAAGGGFTKSNIVPACEPCNRLRGEATELLLRHIGIL